MALYCCTIKFICMLILSIETSCDETACAVVRDGREVLSSVVASQIDIHAATGGVVPEVAAREHVLKIVPVIEEALAKAGVNWDQIEAIAVTRGPGLLSSLIIGYTAAATLAKVMGKPLIPVHHVAGHIYANWLDRVGEDVTDSAGKNIAKDDFPIVILTVSGGHNELVLMRKHAEFELLGETQDDAAGEAFDKIARLLGLGYPGGPAISKAAFKGNAEAFDFPRAMMKSGNLDFSFSGLKTAVLRVIEEEHTAKGQLSEKFIADVAASFQEAVVDVLSEKLLQAAREYQAKEVHLAGGVSANLRLREMVEQKIKKYKMEAKLHYCKNLHYCTDNAAMIGGAAYYLYSSNPAAFANSESLLPSPQLDLYQK
ncbi:tRNA (adenosine(37)-N6)-threonylcarbamoyltransferase complex transferase subunit TsaD [Candidatus Peregrinibacteria bacterium]|nr:tRNA (adenosine(37)-N6)-threonylcarbamoyltransferase complex transferase subunit TsaD [Candidatus Peregrinibacteria bacterium]